MRGHVTVGEAARTPGTALYRIIQVQLERDARVLAMSEAERRSHFERIAKGDAMKEEKS